MYIIHKKKLEQKQTLPSSSNILGYFRVEMLLEDDGLLPFLEDWRFFAEPKIQSNTVVFFTNITFYLYDTYTNIHSLYPLNL